MNDFEINTDIEIILELLDISAAEFAKEIGVSPMTVSRWRRNSERITVDNLNAIYNYAFDKKIYLNRIKAQLFKEECAKKSVVLFHGAKKCIDGEISLDKSRPKNDFGKGFYCGESIEQSAMFVANYPESSLYILEFDKSGLNGVEFGVDRDWMLTIAYFRGKLNGYSEHHIIKKLLLRLKGVDYIIAPIADNRMFEIIDSFIDGDITDIQCQHCLSATNLGKQYVFITDKAVENLKILRHCYLAQSEKKYYFNSRLEESKVSNDKVKIARRQYRGQGKYIEELFDEDY